MGTFTASDQQTRIEYTPVRCVQPVFDVAQYTGDNALAVVEWVHQRAKNAGIQSDLLVRLTDEGWRLINFDSSQIPTGSWIGVGYPWQAYPEDSLPRVLVFPSDAVVQATSGRGLEVWK